MTPYRHIAQFSIKVATLVFFVVFLLVSYHRLMPMNMSMSLDSSMPSSACETICLLGTSLRWQQMAEGVYAVRVVDLGTGVLLSLAVVWLYSTVLLFDKLCLYAKFRWRLPWTRYWSQIYQRGIIPPRLYA